VSVPYTLGSDKQGEGLEQVGVDARALVDPVHVRVDAYRLVARLDRQEG
jgi:hypothetical protein